MTVAVEWRRSFGAPALVLAVLVAEATVVWGNALLAPWSGVVIGLGAGMLVAVGLTGGVPGVLVAIAATPVFVGGADFIDDGSIEMSASKPSYRGDCDPSCGLGLGGALLLALPFVAGFTGLGAALRRLARGLG